MGSCQALNTIRVCKAEAIGRGVVVPKLVLVADDELPAYESRMATAEVARGFYQGQAAKIVAALLRSLPGGTISALTVELLKHEISVRIIPDVCSKE